MSELHHFYRLLSIQGIGPKKAVSLLSKFGSFKSIFSASPHDITNIKGISPKDVDSLLAPEDLALISGQKKLVEKYNVNVSHYLSDDYPEELKNTYDAPVGLFLRGNTELLHQDNYVAIVGTRNPSTYGKLVTENIVTALCNAGFGIISGMAKGIDGLAHSIALENNAPTIGVLGTESIEFIPKTMPKYLNK